MISETLKQTFIEQEDPFIDILGQKKVKQQLKSAILSDRHIIIVGPPGIGKTTLAKNIAGLLPDIKVIKDCSCNCLLDDPVCPACKTINNKETKILSGLKRFVRIQGSPDLTAEDLLGDIDPIKALKFGPLSIEAFTPGKIFKANNGVLFFDEVNRCPQKLQNALLQVLEEGKSTIGSYDVDFPANFIFVGTMNPEDSSTEKLSEVFLDRFDLIYMGYPEDPIIEEEIVKKRSKKQDVEFPDELVTLIVSFVRDIRADKNVEKKPGVRADLGLYERASANAVIHKRKKVMFQDIRDVYESVMAHRFTLKPSVKYLKSNEDFLREKFNRFAHGFEEKESDVP